MIKEEYMKIAIEQAKKGCGWTNPNPLVGAVIVKENRIIGMGYHEKYGELHAERKAIASVLARERESLEGATMYVTLEPCCHYGRTPPCTDIIIESGIKTVVIGSNDPNPLVAGKGIEILRKHGIKVITDILKDECDEINPVFFHYIKTRRPYVVMKYAMTADGKISTRTGVSKWVTGEKAREHVHKSRHCYSAIMVGVGTVLTDDPMLDCRLPNSKNPIRVICDTNLRTPLYSQIVMTANTITTYLATSSSDISKHKAYQEKGCKILCISKKGEHIDLNELMDVLGEEKIDSILLEGGADLNFSALQDGIVNKVQTYIAPKLFGGMEAKTPVGGIGVDTPQQAYMLKNQKVTLLGQDILLEWEVEGNVYRDY